MSEHLRTAGMIILFLLSTIVILYVAYFILQFLPWEQPTEMDLVEILSLILVILMFRASLHLGRRLWNATRSDGE